jgi:PAT family beta-lactamase induction signal transducer AmpG
VGACQRDFLPRIFPQGLGTIAMVSFMSVMADRRYTATQYALLASLAAMGRTIFSGFAGFLINWGKSLFSTLEAHAQLMSAYQVFFILCGLIAIPGLLLAWRINRHEKEINEHYDV